MRQTLPPALGTRAFELPGAACGHSQMARVLTVRVGLCRRLLADQSNSSRR